MKAELFTICCAYMYRPNTRSKLQITFVVPEQYKKQTQKTGSAFSIGKYLMEEKISIEFPGWELRGVSFKDDNNNGVSTTFS